MNDYFAHVVGYASASDLPDASSTIASQLSTLNNKTSNATTSTAGLMSAADKTKLNVVNSDYKTAYKEVYIAANILTSSNIFKVICISNSFYIRNLYISLLDTNCCNCQRYYVCY